MSRPVPAQCCRRRRPSALAAPLAAAIVVAALTAGCVRSERRASWRIYPLPRHRPHDGLAVVSLPAGQGLHIWIDTDTSRSGICGPRWNPDAARLLGGNDRRPTSSGRAPRGEFFAALDHGPLRLALRKHHEALCRERAPRSRFVWTPPPRTPGEYRPPGYPLLEERHLLSDPKAVRRAEKRLLGLPLLPEDLGDAEEPEGPAPAP